MEQITMTQPYNLDDVLKYLVDWRSNRSIKEEFNLTQNQFYHLSRWLVKGGFVDRCNSIDIGLDCNDRITFYRLKKN